jgi:hypothetical protein
MGSSLNFEAEFMKMAKNGWPLALTVVAVQVTIMLIVIAVFRGVAPSIRSGPVVVVSVFLGVFANLLIQKRLAV